MASCIVSVVASAAESKMENGNLRYPRYYGIVFMYICANDARCQSKKMLSIGDNLMRAQPTDWSELFDQSSSIRNISCSEGIGKFYSNLLTRPAERQLFRNYQSFLSWQPSSTVGQTLGLIFLFNTQLLMLTKIKHGMSTGTGDE